MQRPFDSVDSGCSPLLWSRDQLDLKRENPCPHLNSPPPLEKEDGAKKPWHKPAMYDLTDVLDTGGAPTLKADPPPVVIFEDENHPGPTQGKSYRPITT